jgi:ankyrin repeat protein
MALFNQFTKSFSLIALVSISLNVNASDRLPATIQQQLLNENYKSAIPELEKLAKQGNSQAQYQLGLLYLNGIELNKSVKKAEFWLNESAKLNNSKASYLLGSLFAQGKLLPKNMEKAKEYLLQAKAAGDRKATRLYKKYFAQNSLNQTTQQQFFKAITSGNFKEMVSLFQQGASITVTNARGENALFYAINAKQEDCALWLLNKAKKLANSKTFINSQNNEGDTLLHRAIAQNLAKVIIELIRFPVDLNKTNQQLQTPLMIALSQKNKVIAQRLINEKADFSIKDQRGKTALDYAAQQNISLVFPQNKAKQKAKNNQLTANQLKQKLAIISTQAKDKKSPYYQWPELTIAVAQKQSEMIAYLLQNKASVCQQNPQGDNAINLAIKQNNTKLALALLEDDEIDRADSKLMNSLLETAIFHENIGVLNWLLTHSQHYKNINATYTIEQSPLWFAIEYKKSDAFMAIFRAVNYSTSIYGQYLLKAASLNETIFAQMLIGKHALLSHTDHKARDALWYAIDFENIDLVQRLISAGANLSRFDKLDKTPLMHAVEKNNIEIVTALLRAGANVEQMSKTKNNALLLAAQNRPEILRLFLQSDRNIKVRNMQSNTPLMLAVKSQCRECVTLLLKAGANPNRKNEQGQNAFDLAENNAEILSILNKY